MFEAFRVPRGFFDGGSPPRARVEARRVGRDDDEFPPLLREIDRPVEQLWVVGCDLRDLSPRVAIVGARRATEYGLRVASQLAGDLASQGVTIVSGLARGADAAAHHGALTGGGGTIAVMGCGPDVCYPVSSAGLYAQIARRGAIVSEYPPGTIVMRHRLKERNDIVVGVSKAVVVVQGDEKSAAVDTGRRALDLNRDLFAVPGCIDWAMSRGVHELLQGQAGLCTGAGDVMLKAFEIEMAKPERLPIPRSLPQPQRRVLRALADGPVSEQRAVSLTELDAVTGLRAISALELAGFVRRGGGKLHRIR